MSELFWNCKQFFSSLDHCWDELKKVVSEVANVDWESAKNIQEVQNLVHALQQVLQKYKIRMLPLLENE